jgi:hypothetical protein
MTHDPYQPPPERWQPPPATAPVEQPAPPEPPTVPVRYPPQSGPPAPTPGATPGPYPPAGPFGPPPGAPGTPSGQFGGAPPGMPPPGMPPPGPYPAGAPGQGWPPPPIAPSPPRRRTGLVVGLIAGGLAVLLCVGAVAVTVASTLATRESGSITADGPQLQAPAPTAAARTTEPDADPFAGSPAADFAEGEAGIELPTARAVGDFSEAEVAATLELVRDAMIATRIDRRMLVERDPANFLRLMASDNRELLEEDFATGRFGYFATQLADEAVLAVPEPRVEGTVTFSASADDSDIRVIEVVTSFVWAYAFEVPSDDPDLDGIVVIRDELVWQVPHEDDVLPSSTGLWLWQGEAYAWGIDCDALDESLIGPQTERRFSFGGPSEESGIFDPDRPLDFADTC